SYSCFLLDSSLSTSHPPSQPPLFPYTTLFRSCRYINGSSGICIRPCIRDNIIDNPHQLLRIYKITASHIDCRFRFKSFFSANLRSEEHTSELQSRENIVCRLLLEKKNKQRKQT